MAAKKCCNADRPFVWTFSKFLAANESQIPLEDFNDALHTLRPKGSRGSMLRFSEDEMELCILWFESKGWLGNAHSSFSHNKAHCTPEDVTCVSSVA